MAILGLILDAGYPVEVRIQSGLSKIRGVVKAS